MHQPKLDGYRLQAVKESRTVRLFTNKLAALTDAPKGLPARSAVLDCEMVIADASGLPDFTLLYKTKGRGRGAGLRPEKAEAQSEPRHAMKWPSGEGANLSSTSP